MDNPTPWIDSGKPSRISSQVSQRGSAGNHVVLGMHFEEVQCRFEVDDLPNMLGLETDADGGSAGIDGRHGRSSWGRLGQLAGLAIGPAPNPAEVGAGAAMVGLTLP